MNKFLIFSFLGLLVVAAAEWDIHKRVFPPIRKLDQFWVKFCVGNTGPKLGSPSITMVRITEKFKSVSLSEDDLDSDLAQNTELTRLDYATFLYSLGKLNTRSVAFLPTPTFSGDSTQSGASIFPLKNAALRLPRMTVATVVSSSGAPKNPAQNVQYPSVVASGDITALPEITRTVIPADPEVLINGEPAFSQFENGLLEDSERPRFQLIARQGDSVVIGFILVAVARESNIPFSAIKVDLEAQRPFIEVGERYMIPIAIDGSMQLPPFAGLSDSMYTVSTSEKGKEIRDYRFASLEADKLPMAVEQATAISKTVYSKLEPQFESLSQNLVLVGVDRSAQRDIETEAGELLSPMTATARAIATIQSQRHTQLWPIWMRAIGYVSVFLIAALLLKFGRVSALLTPIVMLFFLAILVLIFRQTLYWVPVTAILGLFAVLFLVCLTAKTKQRKADEELEPQSIVV